MKAALPILVAFSAIGGFVDADEIPTTVANATVTSSAKAGADKDLEAKWCWAPGDIAVRWYYDRRSNGPYSCTTIESRFMWYMLNAYRAGGIEGVHWKYTNDPNGSECLFGWNYYAKDGHNLIAQISGRTTTQGDSRSWCAMPVYQPGGVEGKQWEKCICN